jgi:hypothetical protein
MKRGRALSDRRAEHGHLQGLADRAEFGCWYLLLFRNMQRHHRPEPHAHPHLRRRLGLARDAEVLRHHRPARWGRATA